MATVRRHICGAEIVQNWLSPSMADSLTFYDRRGAEEITHCLRCRKKLETGDLVTLRTFRQGDPANYAPELTQAEYAQLRQEMQARVNALVNNLPAGYGPPEKVERAAREAASHYRYTGGERDYFVESATARYRDEIARRVAASVDQAEAEDRDSYAVCMRCGGLFTGELCPNCDQ